MIAAAVNQIARFMVDWMKERFFQKPDDQKVTRIVRYESGTGEVFESTTHCFTEKVSLSLTRLASGASRSDQGRVNSSATVGATPGDI